MAVFTLDFTCGMACDFIEELKLFCKLNEIAIKYEWCPIGYVQRHYFVRFESAKNNINNLKIWIARHKQERRI